MDERPTQWLDEEEMRAWRGLVEVYADVHAALTAELQEGFGFDEGDYGVLVNLSEAPERRLRMCDLAEQLHLSPSGLTRRLDMLVREGLVVRESCPSDRRAVYAVLTARGRGRLEEAAPDHVAGVRRHLIDRLDDEQLVHLAEALERVRATCDEPAP